jgi:hypothetical protein
MRIPPLHRLAIGYPANGVPRCTSRAKAKKQRSLLSHESKALNIQKRFRKALFTLSVDIFYEHEKTMT